MQGSFDPTWVTGLTHPHGLIEIFSDEGKQASTYLGSIRADDDGHFEWNGDMAGPHVTATVTDSAGNTSMLAESRIVPVEPTAVPVFASRNHTAENEAWTSVSCFCQVLPPSTVRRMVPPCPTAVPVFASENATDRSLFVVPLGRGAQLLPPSLVFKIVPDAPTAIPVRASVNVAS